MPWTPSWCFHTRQWWRWRNRNICIRRDTRNFLKCMRWYSLCLAFLITELIHNSQVKPLEALGFPFYQIHTGDVYCIYLEWCDFTSKTCWLLQWWIRCVLLYLCNIYFSIYFCSKLKYLCKKQNSVCLFLLTTLNWFSV